MMKARANGVDIHYQVSGQGPDLVLIHGATENMAFWYPVVLPELVKEYRVIAYDLRGHGYSDMTPNGYTSANMVADLRGLLDYLGVEKAHFIGHSFGGVSALRCTISYPGRVASLVLADPQIPALLCLYNGGGWHHWGDWKVEMQRLGVALGDKKWDDLETVIRQCIFLPVPYGLRKGQTRRSARLLRLLDDTKAATEFREVGDLTADRIRTIRQPVLAIYGEMSPFLPSCRFLRDNLPNCRAVIVPTGHFHPALKPDDFVRNVRAFLRDPYLHVREKTVCQGADRGDKLDSLLNGAGRGGEAGVPLDLQESR